METVLHPSNIFWNLRSLTLSTISRLEVSHTASPGCKSDQEADEWEGWMPDLGWVDRWTNGLLAGGWIMDDRYCLSLFSLGYKCPYNGNLLPVWQALRSLWAMALEVTKVTVKSPKLIPKKGLLLLQKSEPPSTASPSLGRSDLFRGSQRLSCVLHYL